MPAAEEEVTTVKGLLRPPSRVVDVGTVSKPNDTTKIQMLETMNVREERKEHLQVLTNSGYTVEEIKEWRNNLKDEDILLNGKQIIDKKFQNQGQGFSVTGYSFNTQDLNQKSMICWPLKSFSWDPRGKNQINGAGACLPFMKSQQNSLFEVVTASGTSPTSAV